VLGAATIDAHAGATLLITIGTTRTVYTGCDAWVTTTGAGGYFGSSCAHDIPDEHVPEVIFTAGFEPAPARGSWTWFLETDIGVVAGNGECIGTTQAGLGSDGNDVLVQLECRP